MTCPYFRFTTDNYEFSNGGCSAKFNSFVACDSPGMKNFCLGDYKKCTNYKNPCYPKSCYKK